MIHVRACSFQHATLATKKQLITLSLLRLLILSYPRRGTLKASMTKHRNVTKQLGISTLTVKKGIETFSKYAKCNPARLWKYSPFQYRKKGKNILDVAIKIQPRGRSWLAGVLRRRLAWWRWQATGPPPKLWHSRLNFQQTPLSAAGCPASLSCVPVTPLAPVALS